MYNLLIKLMITAALLQLGISLDQYLSCNSTACTSRIEKASRDVLRVNWKPISVFPEEATITLDFDKRSEQKISDLFYLIDFSFFKNICIL